jgi:hypothetical protein
MLAYLLLAALNIGASVVDWGLNPASILPLAMSCASPRMLSRWMSLSGSALPCGEERTDCWTNRVWTGDQAASSSSAGSVAHRIA